MLVLRRRRSAAVPAATGATGGRRRPGRRPGRFPVLAAWSAVLAVVAVACTLPPPPPPPVCGPTPTDPSFYDQMVDHRPDRWLAADLVNSVALPDGRILWMFGDTAWGSRNSDGSYAPGWWATTNSVIAQRGTCTEALGADGSFVPPGAAGGLYWPSDAYVARGRLWMSFIRLRVIGTGIFDFSEVSTELVELSLPDLRVLSSRAYPELRPYQTRAASDQGRSWGSALHTDGTWVYVHGKDDGATLLARASVETPTDLAYWDGTGWSPDPHAAVAVLPDGNVRALPDGRWLGLVKGFFDDVVTAYVADAPQGPFHRLDRPLVAVPSVAGQYRYMPSVHPEIGWPGELLVSVNTGGLEVGSDVRGQAPYRPFFFGPGVNPFGSLDLVAPDGVGLRVAGWAADPQTRRPVDVRVSVNGQATDLGPASGWRGDVGAAMAWLGPDHGFDGVLARQGDGPQEVCAVAVNAAGTPGVDAPLGCRTV